MIEGKVALLPEDQLHLPGGSGRRTPGERHPRSTLILSAADHRALAVLNGGDPLLLPPGSVLQFGDPPGELVVTRIRVILGEDGAVVCAETDAADQIGGDEPAPPHPVLRLDDQMRHRLGGRSSRP